MSGTRREAPAASAEQTSLLPIPCPCGEDPVWDEEIHNWCRCPQLVSFSTVEEWNRWASLSPLEPTPC